MGRKKKSKSQPNSPPENLGDTQAETQEGQQGHPQVPPPGLDPQDVLNAVDASLDNVHAKSVADQVFLLQIENKDNIQMQAPQTGNPNNVAMGTENAENEAAPATNVDNVNRDKEWRLNHERMLKKINEHIARETAEERQHESDGTERQKGEFMAFDVASPSPEEARWIVEFAKIKGMPSVDQTFVNQSLAAMRSTQKVSTANLPAPNQTAFKEADQQILIKTIYDDNSPQTLEEVKFAMTSHKQDELDVEGNQFNNLKILMADLNVDSNVVMKMLLNAVTTPPHTQSAHTPVQQTVVRHPQRGEARPEEVNLVTPPPQVPEAVRKKLSFEEELQRIEKRGNEIKAAKAAGKSPTQDSKWRIETWHELEALEVQIQMHNQSKGWVDPAFLNRRKELLSLLYPEKLNEQNTRVLTPVHNQIPLQGNEMQHDTNPMQTHTNLQGENKSGNLNTHQQPISQQHQGATYTTQPTQAYNQWGGMHNYWQNQGHWGAPLPQASLTSAQAGSSVVGKSDPFNQWGTALVPQGQASGWHQLPPLYGPPMGAPPGGSGGSGWQPPSSHQLQNTGESVINNERQSTEPVTMTAANELMILSKMKLPTFRGKIDRTTPFEYIRQLKTAAEANNISLNAMLQRKIPTLMIQEAANWFAVNRNNFSSWEEFHRLFMEEYSCPNYREQLLRDLEIRRQDASESGTVFLHKIILLCREIDSSTPDYYIIQKAARLMHPEYKAKLHPVLAAYQSLSQFEAHIRQIRADLYDAKTYKPPPPAHEFAEPAFAFDDHKTEFRITFATQPDQQALADAPVTATQPAAGPPPITLSSLNPQITRQRAREAHARTSQQKGQGAYKKSESQNSVQGDRSRSPFRSFGPSTSNSNNSRGYSPGGKTWTSPNGSRWARSQSPQKAITGGEQKSKFSTYQSPSRPADGQNKGNANQNQDQRRQSPHRPGSPSRFQTKAANAEEGKN
jgi:hypothetical protein